jgi:hypothetical protein
VLIKFNVQAIKTFPIMKLTNKALKAINNPVTRRRLMDVLGCTEFTIARYIQKNSDNLTKAAAMQVIREVTELDDSEILQITNH